MEEYTQAQRIISVFMDFTLLIELTGCAGYKVVPNTNLADYNKYNHVIYLEKSRYVLDSTIILEGFLSGIIDSKQSDTRNAIHVYPLTDSFVKIDTADFLTFQWILLKSKSP